MQTKIVHCRIEPCDVYIGRTKHTHKKMHYGNPWKIGRDGTRDEVCDRYEAWLRKKADATVEPDRRDWILRNVWKLHGAVLGCWCAPQRCHGEVLAVLAEEEYQKRKKWI